MKVANFLPKNKIFLRKFALHTMLLLEQRFYCSGFFGLAKHCEEGIVNPMLTEQGKAKVEKTHKKTLG